jgi:hypothetical protein
MTSPGFHPDDFATAEPPSGLTRQWQAWINASVARSEQLVIKICMEAVGEVLAEERNKLRAELAAEVSKLRDEFEQTRRGAKRLRAVPPA